MKIRNWIVGALATILVVMTSGVASATPYPPTTEFESYTKVHCWILPGTPQENIWPQDATDCGAPAVTCEQTIWIQEDIYVIDSEKKEKLYKAAIADGVLEEGEDYPFIKPQGWRYYSVTGPECAPEVTEVPIPAQPAFTDDCEPDNAYWIVPANTDKLTWTLNGEELVVTTNEGYTFPDGKTTHNYGIAPDSGVTCPEDVVEIPVPPVPSVEDLCGPGNAAWVLPTNTDQVDFVLESGVLTAYAKDGFSFPSGQSEHVYGVAPDSGEPCSVVELPEAPGVVDICGIDNAQWIVPQNSDKVTWIVEAEALIARTTEGSVFSDGTVYHNYGVAPDSGELCPTETTEPTTPSVPVTTTDATPATTTPVAPVAAVPTTTPPAVQAVPEEKKAGSLALTGTMASWLWTTALIAIVIGGLTVFFARKGRDI